jgi:uncharacterized cupin superfamily protein
VAAGPNIFEPDWEREFSQGQFGLKGSSVARAAGSQKVGATVYEIPPGKKNLPYHFHHAVEELIIVLSGRLSLRTPEGDRELAVGEVVACPAGPKGGHQLRNVGDEPARAIIASSKADADFLVYPDSNKLQAMSGEFGSDEFTSMLVSTEPEVGYFDGEPDAAEGTAE